MNQQIMEDVIALSYQASEAILSVYQRCRSSGEMDVQLKADESPVTAADLAAHRILYNGLSGLLDGVPVLSEEQQIPDFEERSSWQRYWLIDPLDGTKEFIHGNDEFTVNIALIENGTPIAGVVTVPVTGVCYWAVDDKAFKRVDDTDHPIHVRPLESSVLNMVASRRHGAGALADLESVLQAHFGAINYQSMGSSLKLCLIAEGKADFYPRFAPTCEWDTAAAHAIVRSAGGMVTTTSLQLLTYNTKDSLLNPWFYVIGDTHYPWADILPPIAPV